jgi:hypothetical protein
MISDNIMKISSQRQTLAQLDTEGVTLERYTEKGKKVVFLTLPKGAKYGTPIVHEGRHTVRIER